MSCHQGLAESLVGELGQFQEEEDVREFVEHLRIFLHVGVLENSFNAAIGRTSPKKSSIVTDQFVLNVEHVCGCCCRCSRSIQAPAERLEPALLFTGT